MRVRLGSADLLKVAEGVVTISLATLAMLTARRLGRGKMVHPVAASLSASSGNRIVFATAVCSSVSTSG